MAQSMQNPGFCGPYTYELFPEPKPIVTLDADLGRILLMSDSDSDLDLFETNPMVLTLVVSLQDYADVSVESSLTIELVERENEKE